MKFLLLAIFVVSTHASFLARVRNHWEEKTKKPECHIEFEDVTEPHCETITEQIIGRRRPRNQNATSSLKTSLSLIARLLRNRCVGRSLRTNARLSTAHRVRPSTTPSARPSTRSSARLWRKSNVTQSMKSNVTTSSWTNARLNTPRSAKTSQKRSATRRRRRSAPRSSTRSAASTTQSLATLSGSRSVKRCLIVEPSGKKSATSRRMPSRSSPSGRGMLWMRWRPLMLKKSLLKEGRSDLSQLLLQYLVLELLPAPPLVELSFAVLLAMALEGKWKLGPRSWCRSRATWCRGRGNGLAGLSTNSRRRKLWTWTWED